MPGTATQRSIPTNVTSQVIWDRYLELQQDFNTFSVMLGAYIAGGTGQQHNTANVSPGTTTSQSRKLTPRQIAQRRRQAQLRAQRAQKEGQSKQTTSKGREKAMTA